MSHRGYTLRYWLYATAHGKRPQDMGTGENANASFINWLNARWRQWDALTGHPGHGRSQADMDAFDAWLKEWVGGLPVEAETEQSELAL